MAINWNSDYYVALEGKDLQANAMAVDLTGTYVLLAGRRYIALHNLEEECEIVQKFPRHSKYDVGVAEWNPTMHHRDLCVISSNQRLEVLTWRSEELTQSHCLKAHTRVVTDVNWHQMDPNLLASCSVDTFIHIWDLRDSRRPALSLSAIAEASQVRWNRISANLLATAHEGDIKIWDQRKGTSPVQYVAAHLSKIHGLDWSRTSETQFTTCSQDNTVKFFDTANPRKAEYVLTTNAPVWRARYTPFGNGLITVVVPHMRRGENSLLLWNTANRATPMHTFVGHKDVVLEFAWRYKRPGESCFELVTWSKDQTLLIWKIEPFLQKLCGYEPEVAQDVLSYHNSKENTGKVLKKVPPKVEPLQQEFSLINVHIPNLDVKTMNLSERICAVRATVSRFTVNLQISFPAAYPHGVPPVFEIKENSQVTENIATQLLQTLNHLAQQRVSKNRTCLESCLRQMVTTFEQLVTDTEADRMYENSFIHSANTLGGFIDAYIPFPRTSGAKFCSVDTLVCFGRSGHSRRLSTKMDIATPRALSALENLLAKRSPYNLSVSNYYFQRPRTRTKHYSKPTKAVVHIYDSSGLFLVHKQLAEEYILEGDVGTVCKHNAAAAALVGRWDLVQAWALAELTACPDQVRDSEMWVQHPFNVRLMKSLISHYATLNDVQMAAMLCCIYGKEQERAKKILKNKEKLAKSQAHFKLVPSTFSSSKHSKHILHKSCVSPYHTIPPADVLAEGWVFPSLETMRSSSSLDCLWLDNPEKKEKSSTISNYEYYKLAYAEILHRWGLLYNRAEVLTYLSTPQEQHKGVEFLSECKSCSKPSRSSSCSSCRKLTLNCIICHLSVRGSANCCIVCGHGGHTIHLMKWFNENDVCPSGCGCKCTYETATMF
ncbi:GATOR complex protein WDR59 isoform X2 [Harmonia axyridis]|uniref:GATOR complex protein WDR59 isoform X2 n=1 Tax=Harmonia axyridis TaxID=115357 RepID=UPI001E276651|nr:GATOR complex protein WDR59 isoform X2 [Harmonia axyridis]